MIQCMTQYIIVLPVYVLLYEGLLLSALPPFAGHSLQPPNLETLYLVAIVTKTIAILRANRVFCNFK